MTPLPPSPFLTDSAPFVLDVDRFLADVDPLPVFIAEPTMDYLTAIELEPLVELLTKY